MDNITLSFLKALFPEIPEDASMLIWHLKGKKSSWATSHEQAVKFAMGQPNDCYVGCCLGPRNLPSDRRATASDVLYFPALWLDGDYQYGDVHKKPNLPPNQDAVLKVIHSMPLKPSIAVHTGHGLQPWWILQEMEKIDSEEARARLSSIERRWNKLFSIHAQKYGWVVDSVHDLARVMRLPGTMNTKGSGTPVPVTILYSDGPRLDSLDTIEQYLPEDDTISEKQELTNKITINHNATPPFMKFQAALENIKLFKKTWFMERKDMKDQSMSAYDLSLATQLVDLGWTDQEITDTLICFRKTHHADAKHDGYYPMTLSKAHSGIKRDRSLERLKEIPCGSEVKETPKEEKLSELSSFCGINILRIEKTIADPCDYIIVTDTQRIKLGKVGDVIRQSKFIEAIAGATNRILERITSKEWNCIAQIILSLSVLEDIGDESTDHGLGKWWITNYINDITPSILEDDGDIDDENIKSGYPLLKKDNGNNILIFHGQHLRNWIKNTQHGDRVSIQEMGLKLRAAGATTKSLRLGSVVVKRWVYKNVDCVTN
jgi:hypothetical protein